MSHEQLIFHYMEKTGPINPMIALVEFGCFRLGARINDMKNKGIGIKSQWVTYTNSNGEQKRYKEYWLA